MCSNVLMLLYLVMHVQLASYLIIHCIVGAMKSLIYGGNLVRSTISLKFVHAILMAVAHI